MDLGEPTTLRAERNGAGCGGGVGGTLGGDGAGGGAATLRSGLLVGGCTSIGGEAVAMGASGQRPVSTSVMVLRAATWLSVTGASGEPGEGFWSALVMSCNAARMRSVDEARGIVTLVGNQESVSEMRVARVSHIQTV